MSNQSARLAERFLTLVTTVWFLSTACSFVLKQAPRLPERLIGLIATVRFLTTASFFVLKQDPRLAEWFVTLVATVRFLTRVCSILLNQDSRFAEGLVTVIATVRVFNSLSFLVHGQKWWAGRWFGRLVAMTWSLNFVSLPVYYQVSFVVVYWLVLFAIREILRQWWWLEMSS